MVLASLFQNLLNFFRDCEEFRQDGAQLELIEYHVASGLLYVSVVWELASRSKPLANWPAFRTLQC